MKHLNTYKIFESGSSKEPIDPSLDVEEFKEKFANKKMYNGSSIVDEPGIKGILDNITNTNPTMTDEWEVYGVFNKDDNGRKQGDYILYVKAVSKNHARVKAATIKNCIEYISTGFYGAIKITKEEIDGKIDALQHEIHLLKNPL
jgi:hypothetical protein